MQVKTLHIERQATYDTYPNQLVGLVQIEGERGKMEVKLSSLTVSKIFELVKADVQKVATYNAEQVSEAIEEAGSEQLLLPEEPSDTT